MGCQCAKTSEESKSELVNTNSKELMLHNFIKENSNQNILKISVSDSVNNNLQSIASQGSPFSDSNIKSYYNYPDYSQKIFELINNIRENPSLYANEIENSIINIREEISKKDGKNKIVYKQRVKVALNRGEIAFEEAAKELREISPSKPLIFKKEICIPLPENEEDIKNSEYIKDQVNLIRKVEKIDVFYKDLIRDPEVSALLMIVDDSNKNPGKKRQAVLDKKFKYIGISSGFVGKSFIAYFSFSK